MWLIMPAGPSSFQRATDELTSIASFAEEVSGLLEITIGLFSVFPVL